MSIRGVDQPNNIDVAYGLKVSGRNLDIAVATERNQNRLRVFEISPGKGLRDPASIPVFAQPMGIAIYTRSRDGAIFAVVSRKSGPRTGYIIAKDQQAPASTYHSFAREGGASGPHDHAKVSGSFRVSAATTDGIEANNKPPGAGLPRGLFIAMNDSRRNFILVVWRTIEKSLGLVQ
jgi:myo-inositol-hexaphosphate 3-phosphohydrolase